MTYKAIALTFGYVESATSAVLIFTPEHAFETRKEALHSLAEYLYTKYSFEIKEHVDHINRYKTYMAPCCRKAWDKRDQNNPPEKCPRCGASYSVEAESQFSIDDWYNYLDNIFHSTANSYGDSEVDCDCNWNPWDFDFSITKDEMIIINKDGEVVLLKALMNIHPELLEDINDCNGIFSKENGREYDIICNGE